MSEKDLLVLLTNDDGGRAPGLQSLKREMEAIARVVMVAPDEERSAASHALTIHDPIRVMEISENNYLLTGTPADCVIFALRKLMPRSPDLVLSGINSGPNLGDDILYSGTVAAAREAALYGIPAVAVSLVAKGEDLDYGPAARFIRDLVEEFYPDQTPRGTALNISIPQGQPAAYRFTRQGSKRAWSSIEEKKDPRGRRCYWIGRDESEVLLEADTDYRAISDGVVSITPLQHDQTDYRSLKLFGENTAGSLLRIGSTDPGP